MMIATTLARFAVAAILVAALAACSGHLSIAQFGSTRSINAAAAAAIAMHAWVRQHATPPGG